jgi:catechol-2,3-dioxygenase
VEAWEQEVAKGGTMLLRLLKPRSTTVVPRAADRRLSDRGVLNIALILDDSKSFLALIERLRKLGYPFSAKAPILMGDEAGAIYGHDDQGNSIELGFVLPGHEARYGWRR